MAGSSVIDVRDALPDLIKHADGAIAKGLDLRVLLGDGGDNPLAGLDSVVIL